MDAARSSSGLGSTTRMVGATTDAAAAVSGLATARRRRPRLLSRAGQNGLPAPPACPCV